MKIKITIQCRIFKNNYNSLFKYLIDLCVNYFLFIFFQKHIKACTILEHLDRRRDRKSNE